MESVNLDQVLDGVVEDVKPLLGLLSVELRRSGHLPIVTGNALRIREVFQNLIVNAAKYNDKKEKLVEVGWEVKEATPVFYVRDNGIGIPQQHRENIFRIFKRLHEQNKFGGGTGAGLTIAKKIVERHGGRIWVESSVGVGTTFFFTLQEGL
jgi:light-regulated signal transduction histidine kinase (bacteriophytochrome)